MESSNIILLYQLVSAYEQYYVVLENAYNRQDKTLFDEAKNKIIEIQKKINSLL